MGHVEATFDQRTYRFRNDDGSESGASWKAAENTPISQLTDEVFRLRVAVQETAGGNANNRTIVLQSNINDAGWNDVGPSSPGVRLGQSQHVNNQTPTTRQLTGTSGTFVTGLLLTETSGTDISFDGNDHTEVEWASLLITSDVPDGATVQFRVTIDDVVVDTVSTSPSLTATWPPLDPITAASSLIARSESPYQADLYWDAIEHADEYELQRDGVAIYTGPSLSFADVDRTPATSHTYRVRGINSGSEGPWSDDQTVTTPATPIDQALITFDNLPIDRHPAGWRELWDASGDRRVIESPLSTGQRALRRAIPFSAGSARRIDALTATGLRYDFDIRCRFRIMRTVTNDFRLFARSSGTPGDEHGVFAELLWNSGSPVLRGVTYSPGLSTIGTAPFAYDEFNRYQMHLQLMGTLFRASVWRDGDPEPGWMIDATTTAVSGPGYAGFGEWPFHYFSVVDAFSIGVDGQLAPTIPPVLQDDAVLAPTNLTIWQDGENVILGWDHASLNTHYEVLRDDVVIGSSSGDSFTDVNPPPGTHNYSVRGFRETVIT